MNITDGYLELFIGPMFSGKTTTLINIYNKCIKQNIPVLVINHLDDTRYSNTLLSSHDKIMIPCVQSNTINYIINNYVMSNYSVILINEAQFFPDLYHNIISLLDKNKHIYIFGLDGDYKRNTFGRILDLIPYCDKVTKLTTICSLCGKHAIFTHRITDSTTQVLIGSAHEYIPLCRQCYNRCNTNM